MKGADTKTYVTYIQDILLMILIICTFIEMFFFPSWDNLFGAIVSIISFILYKRYVFRIYVMRKRPISFIAFSTLILFMYLPLPITLLDGNEMSHNLINPKTTYLLQLLYFVCCIIAFKWAGKYSKKHNGLALILKKMGIFTTPTPQQLWVLGLIGWFFKFMLMGPHEGNAGAGTLSIFAILIYAPLILLFYPLIGGFPISKKHKYFVIFYMLAMMILMIATNSRNQLITPLLMVLIFYAFSILYKKKLFFSTKKIISILFLSFVVIGPLSDMAFAMLIVRSQRHDTSFIQLLESTLEIYNDKEYLYKLKSIADRDNTESKYINSLDWDEYYVSSIFLNRVCNYRVADASIYHAQRAGMPNQYMLDDLMTHLKIMFPQPIVDFLFGHIDKSIYIYSPQDILYSISYSNRGLGEFKVGGDVGLALSIFGYFAFPIFTFIYMIEFFLFDNLIWKRQNKIVFSHLILINIYLTYFLRFQVGGGIFGHLTFIIWSFPISILYLSTVYYVVRHVIKR